MASLYDSQGNRMSLLPIVERCDNGTIPAGPFGPSDHLERWSAHLKTLEANAERDETTTATGEFLIPFYLSAPSHLPGSLAIKPHTPPPPPARSRRTSSQASQRKPQVVAPLSHYLPRSDSNEGLADVFAAQAAILTRASAVYTPDQRLLDSSAPIGFLRPSVVKAMLQDSESMVAMRSRPCWKALYPIEACRLSSPRPTTAELLHSSGSEPHSARPGEVVEEHEEEPIDTPECGPWCLAFEDWINEEEDRKAVRGEHIDRIIRNWKQAGRFPEMLGGWRDEDYNIYGPVELPRDYPYDSSVYPAAAPPQQTRSPRPRSQALSSRSASRSSHGTTPLTSPERSTPEHHGEFDFVAPAQGKKPTPTARLPGGNVAFKMERAGTGLFGFLTFGVHLTAYVKKNGKHHIWVPRRSSTKQTWPSMLDNTVAGGITAGDSPTETMVRECLEEASLSATVVRPRLRSVGLVSYAFVTSDGWLQPELQYVYDLELPEDGSIVPETNDGEAQDFRLLSIPEALGCVWKGEWKPNCALVLVDFLVRHGLVSHETDARYIEVCSRLRRLGLPPGPA